MEKNRFIQEGIIFDIRLPISRNTSEINELSNIFLKNKTNKTIFLKKKKEKKRRQTFIRIWDL